MDHDFANHLFSQKYMVIFFNQSRVSVHNFEKSVIYCNGTFKRHAFLCDKCNNIKKSAEKIEYWNH